MKRKLLIILFVAAAGVAVIAFPMGLDKAQSYAASLFVIATILWMTEAIPLYITSLLVLFLEAILLAPAMKEINPKFKYEIFMHPFFSSVISLFLGGLLLAKAGAKYKIDDYLAKSVVRFSGPRPRNILLGMMITTGFISMWMSNTAATAMMLIITMSIVSDLKESGYEKAFFLGIPFAANLGGMGTPVGTPPNAIALSAMQAFLKTPITFLDWMLASVPIVLILIMVLWIILNKMYKEPDIKIVLKQKSRMDFTPKTITVMVVFFLTVILWLTEELHHIPSGITALIPAIIYLGSGILDREDFQSIAWDVLFLVGGGASLAIAIADTGLAQKILGGIPWDQFSFAIIIIIFIIAGAFFTTFMSNTASANIILPLVFSVVGIHYVPVAVATALAISASMSLPVSTPPNALAYSSGKIQLKDMVTAGFIITVASVILIFFSAYLVWPNLIGAFSR